MIDDNRCYDIKFIPALETKEKYIYVMENDSGKFKVGITGDIQKRYNSLCGSNSQGSKIIRLYCSQPTYLWTIEHALHQKFDKYRIPGTEWFEDDEKELKFSDFVKELNTFFELPSYETLNNERKNHPYCSKKIGY